MRFLDEPLETARGNGSTVEMWYLPPSPNHFERFMIWVKENDHGKIRCKVSRDDDGKPVVIPVQVTIEENRSLAMEKYYELVDEYIGVKYMKAKYDAEF